MSITPTTTSSGALWRPITNFDLTLARDARWQSLGEGIAQHDLGLARASAGIMEARLLRTGGQAALLSGAAASAGASFRMLFVFKGSVTLASPNGGSVVLAAGDCAHQPALCENHTVELSANAEVFDLLVATRPELPGQAFALETPQIAPQMFINRDLPAAYIKGDGPRSYFLYRDLGVAAATGRRIHIHVLKATAPSPGGGTGFHTHSMCQLFYVFRGWADLQTSAHADVRMAAGDAMCIAAGTKHNVPEFSSDYAIIEVCIPADYDTVDA